MKKICLCLVTIAAFSMSAVAQESVEAAEQEILSKWSGVQSLASSLQLGIDIKSPYNENVMHLIGGGPCEYMQTADGCKFNVNLAAYMPELPGMQHKVGAVYDGQTLYFNTEIFGKKESKKVDIATDLDMPGGKIPGGGKVIFDGIKKLFNLALLPKDQNDVPDSQAFEGALKTPADNIPLKKVRVYFNKNTGGLLKALALDAEGKPLVTLAVAEAVINQPIPDEHFVFTPPVDPAKPADAAKPADGKAEEKKPEDKKAADAKPEDKKAADAKPEEKKPEEKKPAEKK
jgi:outer membrane lipoprotein-sorting protein